MSSVTDTRIRVISIDPGIDMLGYSLLYLNKDTGGVSLGCLKGIETPTGNTKDRVACIIRELDRSISSVGGTKVVIIEVPQEAMYNRNSKRIQSILKLFAVIYSVLTYCVVNKIPHFAVTPADWQNGRDPNLKVNDWSVLKANAAMTVMFRTKRILAKKEHDIAAALNLGLYAIPKLASNEWIVNG